MAIQRVAYGAAPYGALPTPVSIGRITREDLRKAHARWWRPELASLVVTGGIDPEAARRLGEQLFGDWHATGAAPSLPERRAGGPTSPRLVVIDMPGAGQAAIAAAVSVPALSDPSWSALRVADAVLGHGANGRLFEEVRTKRGLSYGAYSRLLGRADRGLLVATTQTRNETAPEVVRIVLAELDRLGREPLGDVTIERRKAYLVGDLTRSAQVGQFFGDTLSALIQVGIPPTEAARLPQSIDAVTLIEATRAARHVSASSASIVVVGDAKLFVKELRRVRPGLELIPADAVDLGSATLVAPPKTPRGRSGAAATEMRGHP